MPKTYATLICDNEPHTVTYSTILNYAVRKAPDQRESFRATVGSALARRVVNRTLVNTIRYKTMPCGKPVWRILLSGATASSGEYLRLYISKKHPFFFNNNNY